MALPDSQLLGVGRFLYQMIENLEATAEIHNYYFKIFYHAHLDIKMLFSFEESRNIDLISVAGIQSRLMRIIWEQFILPFKLRKIDILYCPNNINPVFLPSKVKSIITIHDLLPFQKDNRYGFVQRAYLRIFTFLSLKKASALITVSYFSKNQILSKFSDLDIPIHVIYNSIKPSNDIYSYKNVNPNEDYFLIIAGINFDKRIDVAIKAIKIINDKSTKKYKLYIVGIDQGAKNSLIALIRELNLKELVIFFGFISDSEKCTLIRGCISLIMLGKNEGFGIPVIEGLAFGKSTIAAPSGALPEIIGGTGIVLERASEDDLARAMTRCCDGESLTTSDSIKIQLAKFSPDTQRSNFWNIFNTL